MIDPLVKVVSAVFYLSSWDIKEKINP